MSLVGRKQRSAYQSGGVRLPSDSRRGDGSRGVQLGATAEVAMLTIDHRICDRSTEFGMLTPSSLEVLRLIAKSKTLAVLPAGQALTTPVTRRNLNAPAKLCL